MNPSRIFSILTLSLLSNSAVYSANVPAPPAALSALEQAKIKRAEADLLLMLSACKMYKLNAGVYPTAEQGLKSLVEKPVAAPAPRRWAQLMDKIPKDPWGHEYRYVVRAKEGKITHVIISDGPDLADSADNIERTLEAKQE